MRLGASSGKVANQSCYFRAERVADLEPLIDKLDRHNLSAIASPFRTIEMDDDECVEFGEKSAGLGIVISEVHFLGNLMARDPERREKAIEDGRALLHKADLMGARCLLGFTGSAHPRGYGACAYNFTEPFKLEVRDAVLRVLDGIDLKSTKYGLEASPTTFYYQPEGCLELIEAVDHPSFGVHLDMMNMVSQATYFQTTELINRTFDLLGDRIFSAHLKDILWDGAYQFMKFDEVIVGDGEMDYLTYIGRLSQMDVDFACMCEHLVEEEEYVTSFERLHKLASEAGTSWVGRVPLQARN
jgi:sugar phosphate isomerase/epimerase